MIKFLFNAQKFMFYDLGLDEVVMTSTRLAMEIFSAILVLNDLCTCTMLYSETRFEESLHGRCGTWFCSLDLFCFV